MEVDNQGTKHIEKIADEKLTFESSTKEAEERFSNMLVRLDV